MEPEKLTPHTTPEDWAFELGWRYGRRARDPAVRAFDEVRHISDDPQFAKNFYVAFAGGMEMAFLASESEPRIADGGLTDIGDGSYKSFVAALIPPKTAKKR